MFDNNKNNISSVNGNNNTVTQINIDGPTLSDALKNIVDEQLVLRISILENQLFNKTNKISLKEEENKSLLIEIENLKIELEQRRQYILEFINNSKKLAVSDNEIYEQTLQLIMKGKIEEVLELIDEEVFSAKLSRIATEENQVFEEKKSLVRILFNKAAAYILKREYKLAEETIQKSIDILPNWSEPYLQAALLFQLTDLTKAIRYLEKAIKLADDIAKLSLWNDLGSLYSQINEPDHAISALKNTLNGIDKYIQSDPQEYIFLKAKALHNLGMAYENKGSYDIAEDCYLNAINLRESYAYEKSDSDIADYALTLNNLGIVYQKKPDTASSINNFNKAFSYYSSLSTKTGLYKFQIAGVLQNIGNLYKEIGNYLEAKHALEESLRICRLLCGESTVECLDELSSKLQTLGALEAEIGNFLRAKALLVEALDMRTKLISYNKQVYCLKYANTALSLSQIFINHEQNFVKAKELALEAQKLSFTYLDSITDAKLSFDDAKRILDFISKTGY